MPKIIDDEQVFSATIAILVRHGYENATTKAIAAAAGIHEATLFRKYGSKFDLMDQAIQHQLADTPLNHLRYTGALEADLLAILRAYVAVSETHGEIMLLLFTEAARDPSLGSFLQTPLHNMQPVLDIIARYQAEGLLREEPPFATVYALIGPIMLGNIAERTSARTSADASLPELDLNQYLDYFLYGRRQTG